MISPLQAIYNGIAASTPAKPKPAPEPPAPSITQQEVDAILTRQQTGTPEQLQQILDRAKEFGLSTWQRNNLGIQLTISMAANFRQQQGIREDPTSLFLRSIGVHETEAGLLYDAERFANELKQGVKAMLSCRTHKAPRCSCWRDSRDRLSAILQEFGDRSPEGFAAIRVWDCLEDLEVKVGERRKAEND